MNPRKSWLFGSTAIGRILPAVTVRVPDLSSVTFQPSYVWAFK